MQREMITPQKQIVSCLWALQKLQAAERFRGQAELIEDARAQLETLLLSHSRGELQPRPVIHAPSWPWLTLLLAVLAGAVMLLLEN